MADEKCFSKCNDLYNNSFDPQRVFCKKGCMGDGSFDECKADVCPKLCIKEELGAEDRKWGEWSKFLSRAPANSSSCLDACYFGCAQRSEEKDD